MTENTMTMPGVNAHWFALLLCNLTPDRIGTAYGYSPEDIVKMDRDCSPPSGYLNGKVKEAHRSPLGWFLNLDTVNQVRFIDANKSFNGGFKPSA